MNVLVCTERQIEKCRARRITGLLVRQFGD